MFAFSGYIKDYFEETAKICAKLNWWVDIIGACQLLTKVSRIFFIGVGGGAGTGSHAANDFNKIAGIESICLSDNVSVLTALANDEGWESIFWRQLEMHKMTEKDCLFIFSVGGGTKDASPNIVEAIKYASKCRAKILGVVGRDTGATYQEADVCILIPEVQTDRVTPHTEDFQMVITHLIANAIKEARKGE